MKKRRWPFFPLLAAIVYADFCGTAALWNGRIINNNGRIMNNKEKEADYENYRRARSRSAVHSRLYFARGTPQRWRRQARYADGSEFQMIPKQFGESFTADDLVSVMDENGVEKAVLLQGQFFGFQNEYTAEAVKKYPHRFAGAGSYDPFCAKAEEVKHRLFKELGFKAVKFEMSNGSGLMAYHRPIDLDGEIMNECYRYAADNGLVVVMDIGRPRNCCWQVDRLASAVKNICRLPSSSVICSRLSAPIQSF